MEFDDEKHGNKLGWKGHVAGTRVKQYRTHWRITNSWNRVFFVFLNRIWN